MWVGTKASRSFSLSPFFGANSVDSEQRFLDSYLNRLTVRATLTGSGAQLVGDLTMLNSWDCLYVSLESTVRQRDVHTRILINIQSMPPSTMFLEANLFGFIRFLFSVVFRQLCITAACGCSGL